MTGQASAQSNPASAETRTFSFKTVAGCIAASIAFVMELTLVPLVLPAIQAFHSLTIGELAWVFNSYGIAVALGVIFGGWFGDTLGIRKVFGAGVVMFACGSLIVAAGANYETLIAGRVLQGLGGGVFSPLVPLLLTRAMPLRPGKILIIWGSIIGYVAAFAPLAVSQLIMHTGWQSVFILFAVLSGGAILLAFKSLAEGERPVLRKTPDLGLLLKAPQLWLVFGYIFCTYGALTFYLFRLPILLADQSYDVTSIGVVLATMWLSFSIVGTLLRNSVDSTRIRIIVLAAPVLIAAGFVVAYVPGQGAWLMISAVLIGIGFACSNSPSTQLVLKFAPPDVTAISMSMDITFARLGGVLTVGLLAHSDFGQSVSFMLGLSLLALICAGVPLRNYSHAES